MALPGSGQISLDDIQTEFGGTNPISISEYYGADTGVPGSGTISLSDFHGTSNTDVTMDTLSFFPTSIGPTTSGNPVTSSATVSGINTSVTLSCTDTTLEGTFTWRVNTGSYVALSTNLSVSNGDTVTVKYETAITTLSDTEFNGALSFNNVTDGNASVGSLSAVTFDASV